MEEGKKYYVLIYANSRPEVFSYCNKKSFSLDKAIMHKERFEEKHNFSKAIVVEEVDVTQRKRETKIEEVIKG